MSQIFLPPISNPELRLRELPDWRLLRVCTEGGGDEPWNELVARSRPALSRVVRRLLVRFGERAEEAAVQDLLQEVYLRLLGGWTRPGRRFRGASDGEAVTFLHRVATRVVFDARRDAAAGKRGGGSRPLQLEPAFAEERPAPAIDAPDSRIEARERRLRFRRRCRALLGARASPRSLAIAELALLDGLSSREIVRFFRGRVRESGVNSAIFRLRRRIERSGVELPRRMRRSRSVRRAKLE